MNRLKRSALACLLTIMLIPLLLTAQVAMAATKVKHTMGDMPVPRTRNLPGFANDNDSLSGVAAISTKNVWAVGTYVNSNEVYQTLIEHWNGKAWSVVKSPNKSGAFLSWTASSAIITKPARRTNSFSSWLH